MTKISYVKIEETEDPTPHPLKPAFGKYITRNTGFLSYLKDARSRIEIYLNKSSPARPLNILLAAPPGSGKSFLVKQLIESIETDEKLTFDEVYVASFDRTLELYSIFQRIQSINLEGKIPVVFFDEVDAKVDQGAIYKKFLSPMWDGTFFIGKEKFYLGKCIFFFAGSTLSVEKASKIALKSIGDTGSYEQYLNTWLDGFNEFMEKDEEHEKIKDFTDRMDLIIRIPPICEALLGSEYEKEYRDLACMLVLKHFEKVKLIGEIALDYICKNLKNGESIRTAEKIIFGSELRDTERFDLFCLPKTDQKKLKYPRKLNKHKREIKLIELIKKWKS